ncbi:MAG: hypothetical protein SH850_26455 [Planctomycetaceae bacterium]|nr:hypothetical protein [Planctomycetaceae bacterium]
MAKDIDLAELDSLIAATEEKLGRLKALRESLTEMDEETRRAVSLALRPREEDGQRNKSNRPVMVVARRTTFRRVCQYLEDHSPASINTLEKETGCSLEAIKQVVYKTHSNHFTKTRLKGTKGMVSKFALKTPGDGASEAG